MGVEHIAESTCEHCGALVAPRYARAHLDWHETLGELRTPSEPPSGLQLTDGAHGSGERDDEGDKPTAHRPYVAPSDSINSGGAVNWRYAAVAHATWIVNHLRTLQYLNEAQEGQLDMAQQTLGFDMSTEPRFAGLRDD